MLRTFEKRMERPDAQKKKAIVIKEKPARKRGGKKYRKMKERQRMTELRKYQNRMWVSGKNVSLKLTTQPTPFILLVFVELIDLLFIY